MAKETIIEYVDDLTGERFEEGETIRFGLDGKSYEIDLTDANAAKLRDALAPYVAHGRSAAQDVRQATKAVTNSVARRAELSAARAWLREHGWPVAVRGRISAEHRDAYEKGLTMSGSDIGATASGRSSTPELGGGPIAETTTQDAPDVVKSDDDDVLAWHQGMGYKVPASGKVNGLMRHRYAKAHDPNSETAAQ